MTLSYMEKLGQVIIVASTEDSIHSRTLLIVAIERKLGTLDSGLSISPLDVLLKLALRYS